MNYKNRPGKTHGEQKRWYHQQRKRKHGDLWKSQTTHTTKHSGYEVRGSKTWQGHSKPNRWHDIDNQYQIRNELKKMREQGVNPRKVQQKKLHSEGGRRIEQRNRGSNPKSSCSRKRSVTVMTTSRHVEHATRVNNSRWRTTWGEHLKNTQEDFFFLPWWERGEKLRRVKIFFIYKPWEEKKKTQGQELKTSIDEQIAMIKVTFETVNLKSEAMNQTGYESLRGSRT